MLQKISLTTFLLPMLLTSELVLAQIPAQTITSELGMVVSIDNGEGWSVVGKTPGTLKIPQCKQRRVTLTGLKPENLAAYKKELGQLQARCVMLPDALSNAEFETYVDAGLLADVTSLNFGGIFFLPGTKEKESVPIIAYSCSRLTDITPLAKLQNLTSFKFPGNPFHGCRGLKDITPLTNLQNLTSLDLCWCEEAADLTPLTKLQKLTSLDLTGCTGLKDLTPLTKLQKLTSLDLTGCTGLKDLTPLTKLQNLTSLNLRDCKNLTDIAPLSALRKLTNLDLDGCEKIRDIKPLAWLPNLEYLDLSECKKITNFYPISGHKKLTRLWLTIPHNDLSFLRNLQRLKVLYLVDCPKLSNVAPLANLPKLRTLEFQKCELITEAVVASLKKKLPASCEVERLETDNGW